MKMLARFQAIRVRLLAEVAVAGVLANSFVYMTYANVPV